MTKATPWRTFIVYSHSNKALRDEIATTLKVLEDKGLLNVVDDTSLIAGDTWSPEIERELKQADLVLPLVTWKFLTSDHCKREMSIAFEQSKQDKCLVVPIIAEKCAWEDTLGHLEVLPEKGKPLRGGWNSRAEGMQSVFDGLRKRVMVDGDVVRSESRDDTGLSPVITPALKRRLLSWKNFAVDFMRQVREARCVWVISRTGQGWFDNFYREFIGLEASQGSRLLCLDPASDAFAVDTALFWESAPPEERRPYWARKQEERRPMVESFYSSFASRQKHFRFKVTPLPLPMALLAVYPMVEASKPLIYIEIPLQRAKKAQNLYLRVEPDDSPEHAYYLGLMKGLWRSGHPWEEGSPTANTQAK